MDLVTMAGGLILVVTVSLSTVFIIYNIHNPKTKEGKTLPPGRLGFPFIGETLEFFTAGRKGKPESFIFDRLKKYSCGNMNGQFKTSMFGHKSVVVAGTAANKLLFSNEKKLVTMWWPPSIDKAFPSTAQLSANEESMMMRKFFPLFLTRIDALKRYIPVMDDCTRRHFKTGAWGPTPRLEAFTVAKDYTFWVACRVFMSIDAQEDPITVESLFKHFNVLLAGIYSMHVDLPGTRFRRAMKASHEIRKAIEGIAKRRRAELSEGKVSPDQDILSHMLATPLSNEDDGKPPKFLNDADLACKILGLLVGGHDTSSTVITFLFKFLAENPHVYDAVYQEQMEIANGKVPGELLNWDDIQKMKYSWCTVCEVMRLTPPVQGAFRQAITDFTHNGYLIPKGWKIYWSTHSTHRSPECFPEPEKFDPTRFEGSGPPPFSFVPFGGGPRMCPGKEYARLQVLTFVHHIVRAYKWEKLIPDEKIIVMPMPFPEHNLPIRTFAPHSQVTPTA